MEYMNVLNIIFLFLNMYIRIHFEIFITNINTLNFVINYMLLISF